MLQSHTKQLQIKYMTSLRKGTELRPEDLGAVRMAMSMALEDLQDEHRQQLNEMDDIIADLIEQRDALKATAGTDAGEILRLQTMEDRLTQWVNQHEQITNPDNDIANIVIEMLTKYRASVAQPARSIPVETFAVNANGNSNGHVQISDLGTRYTGRRLNVDDDQLRELAIAKIQVMAINLGRTPTQADWAKHLKPDEPSLTSVKNRLGKSWNELIADAGLTPNLSSHQRAAQIAAENEEEARTDDAAATFRSE